LTGAREGKRGAARASRKAETFVSAFFAKKDDFREKRASRSQSQQRQSMAKGQKAPAGAATATTTAVATSGAPDGNGWVKGPPTAEGPHWFCLKGKGGQWRMHYGIVFEHQGAMVSDIHAWGVERPDALADGFCQPAQTPGLPVELMD
jgi:hypothetical protein